MHISARHRADEQLQVRDNRFGDGHIKPGSAIASVVVALTLGGCAASNWQAASVGLTTDRSNAVSETDVCRTHLIALRGTIAASGHR